MPKVTSILSPSQSLRRIVTKPSTRSKKGIVVSQNRIASEVGARVLAAGGHAVDAAIATAFTLGVVEPWMSGAGGVGVMMVREAKTGKITGLDFGAVSPKSLDPKHYPVMGGADGNLFGWAQVKENRNTIGATAVCTPSQPLGLAAAHKRWGKKAWADLVRPAVEHAEKGVMVDDDHDCLGHGRFGEGSGRRETLPAGWFTAAAANRNARWQQYAAPDAGSRQNAGGHRRARCRSDV
jgi:gamma-glutamyltranspeptidase / glutathione hydrolase